MARACKKKKLKLKVSCILALCSTMPEEIFLISDKNILERIVCFYNCWIISSNIHITE